MTDTDDALAARLRPILDGWHTRPPPTDAEALLGRYPGGAAGFLRDVEEAARRWVTCRPASMAAKSLLSPAVLRGP